MPTTVAPLGTSFNTTEFEPIRAFFPTTIGPKTLAPAPITTPAFKQGCRLPFFQAVPPNVTP